MSTTSRLSPVAEASSPSRRVIGQAKFDFSLLVRNGEQVLLTLVIPLVLLFVLAKGPFLDGHAEAINVAAPGILALAVLSTCFTSLAIGTGFDRRAGVLQLLGTTPLKRSGLLASRTLAYGALLLVQILLISVVALALGWDPSVNPAVVLVLVLGAIACASWGLALAGSLRAEATLAAANGVFLLLMLGGGVVVPTSDMPSALGSAVSLLPSGALGDGMRAALGAPGSLTQPLLVLAVWALIGSLITNRTFTWD